MFLGIEKKNRKCCRKISFIICKSILFNCTVGQPYQDSQTVILHLIKIDAYKCNNYWVCQSQVAYSHIVSMFPFRLDGFLPRMLTRRVCSETLGPIRSRSDPQPSERTLCFPWQHLMEDFSLESYFTMIFFCTSCLISSCTNMLFFPPSRNVCVISVKKPA